MADKAEWAYLAGWRLIERNKNTQTSKNSSKETKNDYHERHTSKTLVKGFPPFALLIDGKGIKINPTAGDIGFEFIQ